MVRTHVEDNNKIAAIFLCLSFSFVDDSKCVCVCGCLSQSQHFCFKRNIIAFIFFSLSMCFSFCFSRFFLCGCQSPEYCNRKVIILTSIDIFNHCNCSILRQSACVAYGQRSLFFRSGTSGEAIMSLNCTQWILCKTKGIKTECERTWATNSVEKKKINRGAESERERGGGEWEGEWTVAIV